MPMPNLRRRLAPLALLLLAACAAASPPAIRAQDPAGNPIVAEARAFMDAYGSDLGGGDREGIAARYDRGGAYVMFNGEREFVAWDALAAQYRTQWQQPVAFEWRDLAFLPAGPDAVVVNGHFLWTLDQGQEPIRFRYTALLVRQDGELRIRLEDESISPVRPAAAPPAPPAP